MIPFGTYVKHEHFQYPVHISSGFALNSLLIGCADPIPYREKQQTSQIHFCATRFPRGSGSPDPFSQVKGSSLYYRFHLRHSPENRVLGEKLKFLPSECEHKGRHFFLLFGFYLLQVLFIYVDLLLTPKDFLSDMLGK